MTRRLLLTYLTITAFALVVVVVPLGLTFASREQDRLLFDLERDAQAVASRVEEPLEDGRRPDLEDVFRDFDVPGGRIVVVDVDGLSVADSRPGTALGRNYGTRPEVRTALAGERATGRRHSDTLGYTLVYVVVPVTSGGRVHGAVRITLPTATVDRRVRDTWVRLGVLCAVVLATVSAVGLMLARSVTRPVHRLEDAARRLAAGDLGARAGDVGGAPELVALGQQFDLTAERLTTLVDGQRRFVADASHQLRTPLTALRLRLETLQFDGSDRPRVAAALAETERLQHLVESLLVLARAEAAGPDLTDVDLAPVVRGRRDVWAEVAAAGDVDILVSYPDELRVRAVAGGVEQILDNLVSNALAVSPAGTTVRIDAVPEDGGGATLTVTDQGPGMSAEERELARSRFWRPADAGNGGFGLGLAIVDQLATAAGGELVLAAGPDGRGLAATVRLPGPTGDA